MTTTEQVQERPWPVEFETILREHLPYIGDAEVTATTSLPDAGLDSMGTIALLLTLETELDVQFPDELLVAETFETPRTLWSVIVELRDAPPSP